MLVSSVRLHNVKSYADQTVELRAGLTAISGENGAGKSTILEAIGYALFGYLEGPLAGLIREGSNSAEIRIRFCSAVDEREYEVVRVLRLSRSGAAGASARVLDPELGGVLSEGAEEVHKFLRRHLGLEGGAIDMGSIFADVVGVPQGRLIADFVDTPRARKQKFDPLMGTEDYRGSYEALRAPVNYLDQHITRLRGEAAVLAERLRDLPQVELDLTAVGGAFKLTEDAIVETSAELAAARLKQEALTAIEHQLARNKAEIDLAAAGLKAIKSAGDRLAEQTGKAESAKRTADATRDGAEAFGGTEANLREQEERRRGLEGIQSLSAATEADLRVSKQRTESLVKRLEEIDSVGAGLPHLQAAVKTEGKLEQALEAAKSGVDEAQAALQRSRDLADQLKDALAALSRNEEIARDARDAQAAAATVDDLHARVAAGSAALAALAAAFSDVDRSVTERDALERELVDDRAELEKVNAVLLAGTLGARTRASQRKQLQRALIKAVDRGERLLQVLSARVAAADPKERLRLEQAMENARRELFLAKQAQRKAAALDAAESQIDTLKRQIRDLQDRLDQAGKAAAEVEPASSKLDQARAELRALGDPDPRTRLETARTELARQPAVLGDLASAKIEVENAQKRFDELQQKLEPLAEVVAVERDLRNRLDSLRPLRDDHLRAAAVALELPDLKRRLEETRRAEADAIQDLEGRQKTYAGHLAGFDPADLAEARGREAELQRRLGSLQSQSQQNRTEVDKLTNKRVGLLEISMEFEKLEHEIVRTEQVRRVLELIRDSLRDAGPEVTKALLAGVSNAANEIFCEIIGNYAQTLEWDEEYGIWLEAGGYRRAYRQLSGGEQITAALAVRLALLRDLLRIDVAFLDEPTQNLDAIRRENLAEQIQRISGFSQFLVISHDSTFERLLQSVIHVQKVNGVSMVTSG